jgi:hypothetical protein
MSRSFCLSLVLAVAGVLCGYSAPAPSSDAALTYFYERANRDYFDNSLPHNVTLTYGTPIVKESMASTDHRPDGFHIIIDPIYKCDANAPTGCITKVTSMLILHESIHVELYPEKDSHGTEWRKERRRLIVAGAFDELL